MTIHNIDVFLITESFLRNLDFFLRMARFLVLLTFSEFANLLLRILMFFSEL